MGDHEKGEHRGMEQRRGLLRHQQYADQDHEPVEGGNEAMLGDEGSMTPSSLLPTGHTTFAINELKGWPGFSPFIWRGVFLSSDPGPQSPNSRPQTLNDSPKFSSLDQNL